MNIWQKKKELKIYKSNYQQYPCMYTFLNHSSRCLYKNYIQIGHLLRNRRGFHDRMLHFQLLSTLSRKDNYVYPALLAPDPFLSICRSEIQITSTSLLILENALFSNWKRLFSCYIYKGMNNVGLPLLGGACILHYHYLFRHPSVNDCKITCTIYQGNPNHNSSMII